MAERNRIDCACGYSYFTSSVSSRCPDCGKRNTTLAGYLGIIGMAAVVIIFFVLLLGAITWAMYGLKNTLAKWHSYGSLLLGALSIWVFYHYDSYSEYPVIWSFGYGLNAIAILISLNNLYKSGESGN